MTHKYIYLVFTRTGTWLSRLICLFSKITYPHVSLSLDKSFTKMYSFGRTNPDNPFSGGFVEENLYGGVFRKFPNCRCLIYRVKINEEQFELLQEQVKAFLQEKDKYKYNLLGLLALRVNRPLKRKDRFFCSQFVLQLLINAGIFDTDKIPEMIRTDELFTIENKELIYEGIVNRDYIASLFKGIPIV